MTKHPHSRLYRWPWTVAGALCMVFAGVGIILPVLPTTPFVILAAFCFGKGNPKIEAWLLNHRFFGPMILDWRTHGAIAPKIKAMAVAMILVAFGFGLYWRLDPLLLTFQGVCLLGAALYVLSRPNGPGKT